MEEIELSQPLIQKEYDNPYGNKDANEEINSECNCKVNLYAVVLFTCFAPCFPLNILCLIL